MISRKKMFQLQVYNIEITFGSVFLSSEMSFSETSELFLSEQRMDAAKWGDQFYACHEKTIVEHTTTTTTTNKIRTRFPLSLSLTHTFYLTLSLTHTHTHTQTQTNTHFLAFLTFPYFSYTSFLSSLLSSISLYSFSISPSLGFFYVSFSFPFSISSPLLSLSLHIPSFFISYTLLIAFNLSLLHFYYF